MGFLQDITGKSAARAANAAAQDTYRKQQDAISSLLGYSDTLPGQYKQIAGRFDPFISAGTDALGMLRSGLGLGGNQEAFTSAYRGLPGYQAGRDAGTEAVAKRFNAGNMGQSGAAMKGLYRFGSDYEDQRVGDYLTRLYGLAGQGQAATGAAAGLEGQGLGTQAGLRGSAFGGSMNAAGTIGQGMVAGEQAKQTALQNLLATGANLAGSFMGSGFGSGFGSTNLQYPTAAQQGSASTWWPAPRAKNGWGIG